MAKNQSNTDHPIGDTTRLTSWAMLLSHWTSFARRSVALPETSSGIAWKASIAPCIGLQAHVFALAELGDLPPEEHALGLDRAAVGIRDCELRLQEAWTSASMPEGIGDLLIDAHNALRLAREATDGGGDQPGD